MDDARFSYCPTLVGLRIPPLDHIYNRRPSHTGGRYDERPWVLEVDAEFESGVWCVVGPCGFVKVGFVPHLVSPRPFFGLVPYSTQTVDRFRPTLISRTVSHERLSESDALIPSVLSLLCLW